MSVALIVGRMMPVHKGHTFMISKAIEDNETVIVCPGSVQESGTIRNPWTFEQRKTMLKNIYGDRIKIVPLKDIGSNSSTNDWCNYVLEKLQKLGMPEPDTYIGGSEADVIWYKKTFNPENNKKTVIYNRMDNVYPSGSDIRTYLQTNNFTWKQYVPKVNHEYIMSTFPSSLILET